MTDVLTFLHFGVSGFQESILRLSRVGFFAGRGGGILDGLLIGASLTAACSSVLEFCVEDASGTGAELTEGSGEVDFDPAALAFFGVKIELL